MTRIGPGARPLTMLFVCMAPLAMAILWLLIIPLDAADARPGQAARAVQMPAAAAPTPVPTATIAPTRVVTIAPAGGLSPTFTPSDAVPADANPTPALAPNGTTPVDTDVAPAATALAPITAPPTSLPATPPAAAPTDRRSVPVQVYVVQRGDTLFSLSRRYGTTVDTLVSANGLGSKDAVLRVGLQLVIPIG
jgi:LysM repeat protein